MKKHLIFLLILIGINLYAMRTFFNPHYFDGHDAQAHLVRLYQYGLALKDGQILPQWAGDLLAGRGYPVFIFAYPLPYIIAETFHLAGFSLAVAIKLTFVLAYLVSTVGMYFFAYGYWRSRLSGFISALLWAFAPYMFVKIFITASLGVVVSYAFIPWFFLSLYKNSRLGNILSLSLWIMSHPATLVIFSPLIFLFILSNQSKRQLKFTFVGFILALCLSAWYFLPANLELKYTHFKEFVNHQYVGDFVSLKRLLYSKWGTGAPGWSDNPLSQQVGVAQWLAIGLAGLLAVFSFKNKLNRKLWPFLTGFGLSIFLMLSISKPIWDLPTPLQSISTPWRFLSLAVFSAAVSAGYLIRIIKKKYLKLIVFCLLIFLALYGNRNHLRINDIRDYDLAFLQNYTGVATGWNEYLPVWIKDTPHEFPKEKLEVLSGDCQMETKTLKSNLQEFLVICQQDSKLQLNSAYFPGWQVKLNQQNITDEIIKNLANSNGMMQLKIKSGNYHLTAQFSDTPLRLLAKIISLLTLATIVINYSFHRFDYVKHIFLTHMRVKRQ